MKKPSLINRESSSSSKRSLVNSSPLQVMDACSKHLVMRDILLLLMIHQYPISVKSMWMENWDHEAQRCVVRGPRGACLTILLIDALAFGIGFKELGGELSERSSSSCLSVPSPWIYKALTFAPTTSGEIRIKRAASANQRETS